MKANLVFQVNEDRARHLSGFMIDEHEFAELRKARNVTLLVWQDNVIRYLRTYDDFNTIRDCPPFDEPNR